MVPIARVYICCFILSMAVTFFNKVEGHADFLQGILLAIILS